MLTIRPAQISDADALGRVHVQVWRETYPGIVPQRVLDNLNEAERAVRWRSVIGAAAQNQFAWCAFEDDRMLGFCAGGPAREAALGMPGEIFVISILKAGQGRGFGRALMRAAANNLMNSGFKSAGLWVFVENHNARNFYRRIGGIETNIRKDVDFDGEISPEMAVHWGDLQTLV